METETGPTLKERLDDLEKVVIEFEKKLQLDKIKMVEVDLDVDKETISKMTAVDVNMLCMEWAGFALAVQKELNVATSRFNWADSILNQYLAEQSQNYKGFSYNERCAYVVAADSYAQKVEEFKRKCKMIMDRNWGLTNKIEFMIKMAQGVAYAKRGEKNDG